MINPFPDNRLIFLLLFIIVYHCLSWQRFFAKHYSFLLYIFDL